MGSVIQEYREDPRSLGGQPARFAVTQAFETGEGTSLVHFASMVFKQGARGDIPGTPRRIRAQEGIKLRAPPARATLITTLWRGRDVFNSEVKHALK